MPAPFFLGMLWKFTIIAYEGMGGNGRESEPELTLIILHYIAAKRELA
jgi:hypothetical protein